MTLAAASFCMRETCASPTEALRLIRSVNVEGLSPPSSSPNAFIPRSPSCTVWTVNAFTSSSDALSRRSPFFRSATALSRAAWLRSSSACMRASSACDTASWPRVLPSVARADESLACAASSAFAAFAYAALEESSDFWAPSILPLTPCL